ncbi:MAG: type II toxin-antitoxin system Phd/YefM family antitoxin [Thermomicrobiales bacterium]
MSVVDETVSMSVAEVRENFADVLNRIAYSGERIGVSRHGKVLAVMVPFEDLQALEAYEDWRDQKLADEAWENYQREGGVPIEIIRQELDAEVARLADQH